MKRLLIETIELCNDCPYCNNWSLDGVAHVWCTKQDKKLDADGKVGTEIMYGEING